MTTNNYKVKYDKKNKILTGFFEGDLNQDVIDEYVKEAVKLGEEHDCKKILTDITKAQIALYDRQVHDLPSRLDFAGFDQSWKRALLIPAKSEEVDIFHTSSKKLGYPVENFREKDKAIEWLLED